ncbi:DUF6059 family protein [Streptomyces pseudovenezuelae]|uniref:Uncharacterized protein n=1 Tax=Streptomyces pseudovenezuelae TaxID=67350 RepID=A0ABT6M329_9ACTN|nr:DUF6059 family protein [Streptomyces pseudovenezuelae]MDH6222913.1 hypothetical protein [Streptomyces pseudovenezuelae]
MAAWPIAAACLRAIGRALAMASFMWVGHLAVACLRALFRALATAGCMWVGHLPVPDEPARERIWATPPPGHPERLRPDIPLSEVERHLARSLSRPEDIA